MKIILTGSDGMLGWGFKKVLTSHEAIYTDKQTLDITDIDQVMSYTKVKPDIILHLAAETDHHRAESKKENTLLINHGGTENMVELARELNIPIMYVGTCGMFNGAKTVYSEEDEPSPLNCYGESKFLGELAVKAYPKHFIIRAGWGMGGGREIDKKFINKIFQQLQAGKKVIYAIKDVFGSPTYFPDYAAMAMQIIEKCDYGTYHVANRGDASRADVAQFFIYYLGARAVVVKLSYEEYHEIFGLKVPYTKHEVLSTQKIFKLGLGSLRHWKEALKEYTDECFR
jgi:dTDP-4-dehydrorhamnose reductase